VELFICCDQVIQGVTERNKTENQFAVYFG